MSVQTRGLGRWGVILGLSALLVGGVALISVADGSGRVVLIAQKAQKKKTAAKKGDNVMPRVDAPAKAAATLAEGELSFKRDIAPILVRNCQGCHTGTGRGITVGKLDMSTFDKLMAGGKRGKDIVGGDPDTSMLVLMIKGEETPKMPPNNGQRGFAEEAAEKIATWVKQGAKLDAGLSATDPIAGYAASLDDLRKAELAKLSPEERDKLAKQAGIERWKKATKVEPEVTTSKGGHFLLLSKLPAERAKKLLQAMEAQFTLANKMFSSSKGPVLGPTEKIGLYVFNDAVSFVEFVRIIENQEVEAGEQSRAKLTVESPYIVAVDPSAGGEESSPAAARKGAPRSKKKTEEAAVGPERTLASLLTEQLIVATANRAGKPPKWLSLGLGTFLASHLDYPASPYYRRLRAETLDSIRIGWQTKAVEVLGGQGKIETTRAIGFSMFEWIAANAPPAALANFAHAMLEGQEKLDDSLGNCLNLTREEFLVNSELWLSERYRR